MAWNFALTIGAAVAGLLGMRYVVHEPDFDFQLATPKYAPAANTTGDLGQDKNVAPNAAAADQVVSIRLHDAHVGDVLSWLENQGVNFIVSDEGLKARSMTLNIANQKLDTVVDAIGAAMGGHWEHQGAILVFEKGSLSSGIVGSSTTAGVARAAVPALRFEPSVPPTTQLGQCVTCTVGTLSELNKTWNVDEHRQPAAQPMDLIGFQNKGINFGIVDEFKGFEQLGKSGELKNFPGLGVRGIFFGGNQFERLLTSLTLRQKHLEDEQGYLKITDLTPDQQRMLGVTDTSQEIEIKYQKSDGAGLVIKSS